MNEETRRTFSRKLDALRRERGPLDPSEIARLASNAGLTAREALFEIQDHLEYPQSRMGRFVDVLAPFVSLLCIQSKAERVLEYVTDASILTAHVAGRDKTRLTYISPNQWIIGMIRELFREQMITTAASISEIPPGTNFDAIVCQPPIGSIPSEIEADRFGGEVARPLASLLTEVGTFYWITGRGVLFSERAKRTLSHFEQDGLRVAAAIEVAPGAFRGTGMPGAIIALRREVPAKRLVGSLRDIETVEPMASAFLVGPVKKDGPSWTWLERDDHRTFSAVEQARLLQKLTPKGRHEMKSLGSLLTSGRIEKSDKPLRDGDSAAAFLFIPEYAGSRVTADLEEQTVKPSAVYRVPVDPASLFAITSN